MAPRPFSTTIRSRAGRRIPAAGPPKPSIYAVHSGPQRGVHLLSPDPPPRELQYRYRHPINHHPTFLTFSGDFLRRRFDSIDEAVKWIDERDREEELVRSLEDATIGNGKGPVWRLSPPSLSSSAGVGGELTAEKGGGMELERLPRRDKERKQWKEPVFGMRAQGVGKRRWEEREKEKVCCVRAKVAKELVGTRRFSYSHLGVRVGVGKEAVAVRGIVESGVKIREGAEEGEMEVEEEL